jgi:hypothetical protein
MKKITIELTETAYTNDEPFKETAVNMDNETFSGYGFNLKCVEGYLLEVEMNGMLNLGEVNWKIESTN